jgi:hypothetical protein
MAMRALHIATTGAERSDERRDSQHHLNDLSHAGRVFNRRAGVIACDD